MAKVIAINFIEKASNKKPEHYLCTQPDTKGCQEKGIGSKDSILVLGTSNFNVYILNTQTHIQTQYASLAPTCSRQGVIRRAGS
jgi:hypothetical protein